MIEETRDLHVRSLRFQALLGNIKSSLPLLLESSFKRHNMGFQFVLLAVLLCSRVSGEMAVSLSVVLVIPGNLPYVRITDQHALRLCQTPFKRDYRNN